ncbi:MAG: hypothetical protein EOO14_04035 [Chitinophagaceae bacterium]|nr:MAG: hypothetical protein EOO14_04035 [Chitinophagaceae bacterium]
MKRFDFFQPIHNQIRAQLYETGALVQHADVDQASESGTTLYRLQGVLNLLQVYMAFGELHILPAITAYESAIADSLLQERAEMGKVQEQLKESIDAQGWASQPPGQGRETEDLATCFESLALQMIQYLRREENLAGKLLWRYYSDEELQALATKLWGEKVFAPHSFSGKTIPAKEWHATQPIENESCVANASFYQTMTARAASFLYPQQRSLLQDVLAGGMVV